MSDTVIVICDNPHHRQATVERDGEEQTVSFQLDKERGAAVAEVPPEVADVLTGREAYRLAEEGAASEDEGATPTSAIDGIGPTREEELAGAGIETVADLADAAPEAVADAAGVSEEKASTWIGATKAHE